MGGLAKCEDEERKFQVIDIPPDWPFHAVQVKGTGWLKPAGNRQRQYLLGFLPGKDLDGRSVRELIFCVDRIRIIVR